ncbi:MAG: hypothetical protein ACR2N2_05520 [Acidimicrobiia bacterium]
MEEDRTRATRAIAGGDVLARMMRRRGWSAPEVSRRTNAEVSPSSVLAYMQGTTLPTGSSAFAVASILGREDADELLRAWGLDDMADAIGENIPEREPTTALDYHLDLDSRIPGDSVPIGWKTTVEVVGRIETSLGIQWIIQTAAGSMLTASPIISFTGNEQLGNALRSAIPEDEG